MRAVIQRVHCATIVIDREITREIKQGLVVFLGVMEGDTEKQSEFLAQKICELRIFRDDADKMNRSLEDIFGDLLVVSNFTLSADCKKGRRPSFDASAPAKKAEALYRHFIACAAKRPIRSLQTGEFGAHMDVTVHNDGPVTIQIDTQKIGK